MVNTVYNILAPLNIPIKYILRPDMSKNKIGISYHFFNEGHQVYGDGKGKQYGGNLQVDIFSTIDYTNNVKEVVSLLETNNFRLADSRDSDDSLNTGIQYYQKVLIFNYTESEVK